MNDIEKILRKVSPRDRAVLITIIRRLKHGDLSGLRAEKMARGDFYKMRKGNFRLIFHFEHDVVIIDAVRLRDEKTYRDY